MTTVQTPVSESTKTQVLKDAAVYVPSTYVAQFFGLISAFLIRNLLGPTMMGIWATLQIVLNYGGYLNMGAMSAGAKEIPYHLGRKDHHKVQQIQDNIFTFSLLMSVAGAILILACGWFIARDMGWPVRIGLVAIGLMLIGQRVYNYVVMLLRGYRNFSLLSKLTIFTSVIDVVLAGSLIWLFGIYGLYMAVLGSLVLSCLFVWKRFPYRVHLTLDRKVLRDVTGIGLPLLLVGIVFTLLRTVDKILVVKYLGATQMGIYSIALMASNYILGLSNTMGILTLPHYSEKFGDKQNTAVLCEYVDEANRVMGALLPVVLGALYIVVPLLIRVFLKQYVGGIPAMQILLMGSFFLCLVHQPNNFLLAIGKQTHMLPAILAGVVLAGVFNYWAVCVPKSLVWVSLATSSSYLVTFCILFATANFYARRNVSIWGPLVQIVGPFFYSVAVLLALDWALNGVCCWWVVPVKLFFFGAASFYPVWKIDRQTQVVRRAWRLFWDKARSVGIARGWIR